jgi:Peptidase MA superfamily
MSGRRCGVLVAVLMLLGPLVVPAKAAGADFGTPTAASVYGTSVSFTQPVTLAAAPRRVEVLLDFPGALGPIALEVPTPGSGSQRLHYDFLQADAQMYPNTKITARWRVTPLNGPAELGPPVTVTYADTTKQWKTLGGTLIRLHWYSGSAAFAQRALALGEQGVRKAADLLGVTETEAIDFFVYGDAQSFCGALLMGSTCNVAGRAIVQNRTMFGLIESNQADSAEVARVIPHELTHLVFNTATQNPYHSPPDWLNEGLAVYLTEGVAPSYRAALTDAVAKGTLQPLEAYTVTFPPQALYDRFILAYAESVSAVDFMVRRYGQPALVKLIRSYAAGRTDDEAFSAAIGVGVSGFEAAWLAGLGATAPTRYGPQPAPTGPQPPGWDGTAASSAPAASPTPSGTTASPTPDAAASDLAVSPSTSGGGETSGGGASGGPILLAIAAVGLGVGGLLGYVRRRRTLRAPGAPDQDPPEAAP